jgi:hypothetical protein
MKGRKNMNILNQYEIPVYVYGYMDAKKRLLTDLFYETWWDAKAKVFDNFSTS